MSHTALYFIAAGSFLIAAVLNFFTGDAALGAACIALGTAFIAIDSSQRRNRPPTVTPPELSEAQQREVQTLVDGGWDAQAIRQIRKATGASLLEAKRYVERLKLS